MICEDDLDKDEGLAGIALLASQKDEFGGQQRRYLKELTGLSAKMRS